MRETDQRYFDRLDARLKAAFDVATQARRQGKDPEPEVEIPVAKDMADRVENILGITGVADRVRQLEAEMGREAAALELARDFAEGRVGDYDTREGKIEGAVRTAVALLTEGVVAAPIEGIDRVEIRPNDDGTEFVRLFYAGPIRSAGGTAQALSVLVADYTRTLLGLDHYKPREDEIERYAAEVSLYDSEVGLQYSPKEDETKYIARNCPIMLDGEATSDGEVSGYRNLERVDTNRARGGMCLVLAEGIALKAPKIERYTGQLDEVDWPWVDALIEGTFADTDEGDEGTTDEPPGAQPDDDEPLRPEPSSKYLRDLIAGRPVFGHPSEPGGFRLRYGRARNHGFATAGVHPATMRLVDDFLATGTQLKTERPGKAAGVVPVDSIEGPTVKLATGEVRRIDDPDEAKELRNGVVEILDLGEYLVNVGEFVENNHALAPASYTVEWWVQELAETGADVQALDDSPHVDLEYPTAEQAIDWASSSDAPLHPAYTYCWHDLAIEGFTALADAVEAGHFAETDGAATVAETDEQTLVLPNEEPVRDALETLLIEHTQGDQTITVPDALPLIRSLGFSNSLDREWADRSADARDWADGDSAMDAVNAVAPFTVRERAPTRIGSRMGRPEKSEKREMNPAVHTLFPIGEAGGDQRDITAATGDGTVEVEIGRRTCPACGTETYRSGCPDCGEHTESDVRCPDCDIHVTADESGRLTCPRCGGEATSAHHRPIDLKRALQEALDAVGERDTAYEILKGVKGLTSAAKTPEPIEKGVLRAKHGVSTFKDGTVRYDMTDLPVTAVRPSEIGVSVEQLRDLGYETDLDGDPLEYDDQLVPLRVQDVLLSDRAGEHLVQVADFVDDLLEEFYGLEPFYEVDDRTDLVGELVFGLAPHTSAAVIGRIAGFTGASVGYAHPYFHAAKRRNCFHPDTKVWYREEDGDWQHERIERLVEDRLDDPWQDDFGAFVQELDRDLATKSIDDAGRQVIRPIEAVSKHPAPTHLIEIHTAKGQQITVTPDHTMIRWTDGIEKIPASRLSTGDKIPVAPGSHPTSIEVQNPVSADGGTPKTARISDLRIVSTDINYTYNLTVSDTHTLYAENMSVAQCDGDEDSVMLLMDGLLNFSKAFLPQNRGGRMDSPLVMSSRIDPSEIDDEAHNMDIVDRYPLEFYEATQRMADPSDVDIELAEATVGTDREYAGFDHTHDTSDIALGPSLSAYKTLGSMDEKLQAQLELARKLRAVDESDVAERIIEYHFLPDLLGNLRAFSRQETRCLDCGTKYRRPPLTGSCRECGGNVNLTVHEGSVSKYLETAITIADEYGAREYTKQRLEVIDRALESIFVNDKNKQSGIADFM